MAAQRAGGALGGGTDGVGAFGRAEKNFVAIWQKSFDRLHLQATIPRRKEVMSMAKKRSGKKRAGKKKSTKKKSTTKKSGKKRRKKKM